MKKLTILLFLVLPLIYCVSCTADDELIAEIDQVAIPPFSTEGKNTFACYINGEPWKASVPFGSGVSGVRAISGGYYLDTENFGLVGNWIAEENEGSQMVRIQADSVKIGSNTLKYYKYSFTNFLNQSCIHYKLDTTKEHILEIVKLDLENKVVSGRFNFTACNSECQDTVVITSGQFDIPF